MSKNKTPEVPVCEDEEVICEKQENEIENKIQDLENQLNEQKDRFLRTLAEYENFRKRTEREKSAIYSDATAMTITGMLPVADSIDRAIESARDAGDEYKKGLELIKNQLMGSLAKLGVESFGECNEEFNPDIHNAVSHIDDDAFDSNSISIVFQKGYKVGDKIIRHAMVQVAN